MRMDEAEIFDARPFDAFLKPYVVLKWVGFTKLSDSRSYFMKRIYNLYRIFVICFIIIYTSLHIVYAVQLRDDPDVVINALILTIPEFNYLFKILSLYFGIRKQDELIVLMKDKIFGAQNKHDNELIRENTRKMQLLWRIVMWALTIVVILWVLLPISQRLQDETTKVPSYMPFKQDTWPMYLLACFFETIIITPWIAYGHISIDFLMVTYYAQCLLQLKIINYNLEHLFEGHEVKTSINQRHEYIDTSDNTVQNRFIFYIKRYEKVCWFTRQVTSLFNLAITAQFCTTLFSGCLVVYQMSSVNIFTIQFAFSMGFYLVVQFEIFGFCYFGGMIEYESRRMVDSIYLSQWTLTSPKFRKQLVIAMCRWMRPITPRACAIVPLSLSTFVTITRSAYTLYTILKTRNNLSEEKSLAF